MYVLILLLKSLRVLPDFILYLTHDFLVYLFYRRFKLFYGWGIHLFTGKFGAGKTSLMVLKAYKLCEKYPQLHIVTNLKLDNFPAHTQILPLNTAEDILNAPKNTIVLIDEIGTLFNSRDFSSGKKSVPKPVFQHLCQCRHRHMMLLATVQRFTLLDKQIRDITASVTECKTHFKHPFSRLISAAVFDIDEYEAATSNPLYEPRPYDTYVEIQTEHFRHLYDTMEMVSGFLEMKYLSDEEILRNQGSVDTFGDGSKAAQKAFKRGVRRRR